MPRRFTFALAFLSALTGCVAAPPSGPLVEYREGLTPITRPVKCRATYALCAHDRPPGEGVLASHCVAEGERIGFRREEDGSVTAVAPGYTLPLAPGSYSWEVVRESVPPWRERFWQKTRDDAEATVKITGTALGVGCLLALLLGLAILYAYAEGNSNRSAFGR